MYRIGVISDTHLSGDNIRLSGLAEVWGRVDLILHAGDITSPVVLAALRDLAETVAVAGNMDGAAIWASCPRAAVVPVGRYRIGLTHGDFMHSLDERRFPRHWRQKGHFDTAGLHAYLRSQFEVVDAIVFGHTHCPHNARERGVLYFNPGAWRSGGEDMPGTVGLLWVDESGIRGEILPLVQTPP